MIKKNICFFSFLFILLSGCLLLFLFHLNQKDYNEYQKMKDTIWQSQVKQQNACQKRKKICKDIWIGEKEFQRLVRIKSDTSDIFVIMNAGKIDLMENLYNIECLIENSTFEQQKKNIYFFNAANGHYLFRSHNFLANNISIWFFKMPTSHSPYSVINLADAYLNGKANDLLFVLTEKKPYLKVSSLKAKVFPEREIR